MDSTILTKEKQEEIAATIEREILIIDAYNATCKFKGDEQTEADRWSVLGSLTNEELKNVIYQNNKPKQNENASKNRKER